MQVFIMALEIFHGHYNGQNGGSLLVATSTQVARRHISREPAGTSAGNPPNASTRGFKLQNKFRPVVSREVGFGAGLYIDGAAEHIHIGRDNRHAESRTFFACCATSCRFSVDHENLLAEIIGYVTLPVIGTIKMHEELRFIGKPLSVTISREADRWFAAIAVDMPDAPQASQNQAVCGVDLGISRLATVSDGTIVLAVASLKCELKRLRRCSRALSRKVKGSSNRRKAKHKLAVPSCKDQTCTT